ncbi:MAG: hypothetical protein RIR70_2259 [Pseudomonadota bacterium]|jgi:hypothetical protein
MLKRAKPEVLVVPPGIVLELFALARFASRVQCTGAGLQILIALRRMRPDVPEFSSYAAMAMIEGARFEDAIGLLEEYLASGFDDCSLVRVLLAYSYFKKDEPAWVLHARRSVELAFQDGGSSHQRDILALLPVDVMDAH